VPFDQADALASDIPAAPKRRRTTTWSAFHRTVRHAADCTTSIGVRHTNDFFARFTLIVWQALGAAVGSKRRCRRPPERHVLPEDHPLVGAVDLFNDGAALVRQPLCVRCGHLHALRYPFLI
jgi:hypothetical protein